MPVLTAALSSLPVEAVDVLPIGTLEALQVSNDGSEQTRMCGCFECERCFGCERCFRCERCFDCERCHECGFCG